MSRLAIIIQIYIMTTKMNRKLRDRKSSGYHNCATVLKSTCEMVFMDMYSSL